MISVIPTRCTCRKCRWLPTPEQIGDAHEVAVVLHLDVDSAWDVASHMSHSDTGRREIETAIMRWEAARDV